MESWQRFRETLRANRSKTAISGARCEVSFGDLGEVCERVASALSAAGVAEGDVSVVALPNRPAFVPIYLALCKLGNAVVLVSPLYREDEMRAVLDATRPRCIVTSPGLREKLHAMSSLPTASVVPLHVLGEPIEAVLTREEYGKSSIGSSTCALVKYTSGSMGEPKGIALSDHNVITEAENVVSTLGVSSRDRILASVPLFHSYGFDLGVLPMLLTGATLLQRETFVPRQTLRDMVEQRVSVFLGVPSMYRILAQLPDDVTRLEGTSLRYLLSCTAPLNPETIVSFHRRFGVPICQHYGSSETGGATLHDPSEVLQRLDSVGRALHGVEVTIVDSDGREVARGTEGEVVVRSGAVAMSYVSGGVGQALQDGSFATGDLGRMDAEGFVYLLGRKDHVINVGGMKVAPLEVVRALESHSAVREAAVTGVKDRFGEECVYAVLTVNRPIREEDILQHCRERLSDYKVPRRVEIRDVMPHGPSGKIQLRPEDVQL